MSAARYAIYFAPEPGDSLNRFGASVLCYDADTGHNVPPPPLSGVDPADWREWSAEPRRYGFHATLKAPFRLEAGLTENELFDALAEFSRRRDAFGFDLEIAEIGLFIALVAAEPCGQLALLERDLVETFEPFRAPLDRKEIARRLAAPLSQRQRSALDRYGYPYVFEDFRFHMTLSGPLTEERRLLVMPALRSLLNKFTPQPRAEIRSLAVFRQDSPQSNFRIVFRAPLRRLSAT